MFIRSLFNFSVLGAAIACAVVTPQVITPQLAFASPASDIEPASDWQHEIQQLNQQCDRVNRPMDCNPS